MTHDDFSYLTGHTIESVAIDNEAGRIVLKTYHSEDGWFDAAGMWIGILETQHELLFSNVVSHIGIEYLKNEVIGTITHEPTQKSYVIITKTNKRATINATQLDVIKHD